MDSDRFSYALRAVTDADRVFLATLYASTREEELSLLDWTAEATAAFCQSQCHAQRTHYETHFPNSVHEIIVIGAEPVGRLWLDWRNGDARLLDVALLPTWRGRGLGSQLMRGLQDQAQARGVGVTLSVEHNNPKAKRFYRAHGFGLLRDTETHDVMKWPDPGAEASAEDASAEDTPSAD